MPTATAEQQEPDTVLRNFRLIASWRNFLIFVVNPALSWAWFMFTCLYLMRHRILDDYLSGHQQFFLGGSWTMGALILECIESDKIKARLTEAGYVERRTRSRENDLLLNVAVLIAAYYWIQRWPRDKDASEWWLGALIVISFFIMWGGLFLLLLGPTMWFTVRAR